MPRQRGTKREIEDTKQQYGMWLGLPEAARPEKTLEELAKRLGVWPETLCRWREDTEVLRAKENAVKAYFSSTDETWEFMETLKKEAKTFGGSPQIKRLYAEITGLTGKAKEEVKKAEPLEIVIKR